MSLKVTPEGSSKEEIKQEIEQEISEFQTWFRETIELTNLLPVEASILRTYLHWKTRKES
jgi:type II secretory pathway component GspD/PulD (secretin)